MFYFIKRAFRTFWALYCIIPFMLISAILTPFVVICTLFKGGRKPALFLCLYIGSPVMLALMGIFPKVRNRRYIEKNRGYVIVCNHNSYIDIVVNPYAFRRFPNVFTFLSKKEVTKIPIFGVIVKRVAVLVDRKSGESRKKSYLYMKKVLDEGISVFIYPEGTRNTTDKPLQTFFDGAFRLAIEMQTPILVQTVVGINNISNHKYLLDLSPGKLECIWDKPIETQGMTLADLPELKKRVHEMMTAHLVKK